MLKHTRWLSIDPPNRHAWARVPLLVLVLGLLAQVVAAAVFKAPVAVRVDGLPLRLLSGRFNDDSAVDLVSLTDVGEDGPSLSVLLNRGDGSFTSLRPVVLDPSRFIAHALGVGDLNGDALSDVAVAVTDLDSPGFPSAILIYTGAGAGRLFGPQVVEASGGQFPSAVEIGDVNGDQIPDLVLCDSQGENGNGRVLIFPGERSPEDTVGFAAPMQIIAGSLLNQIVLADLDHDGLIDIVLMDAAEDRLIGLYGVASGPLAPVTLAAFDLPSSMVVTRADADERLDLVVAPAETGQLTPFLQPLARQFVAAASPNDANGFGAAAAADFDTDGRNDLVATSRAGDALSVLRGDGLGSFISFDTTDLDSPANQITIADLNGDQRPDVALTRSEDEAISVLLNVFPRPVTSTPTPGPTSTPAPVLDGDANCDGHIDRMDLPALVERLFNPGCVLADVNRDSRVTSADLVSIQRFL